MRPRAGDRVTAAHETDTAARLAAAFDAAPAGAEAQLRDAVRLGRSMLAGLPPGAEAVAHVAAVLYAGWYSQSSGVATPGAGEIDPVHVETLRAAHAASARFEDGWIAEQVAPNGQVVAARGPVRRVVDAIDYLNPAAPGRTPAAGGPVRPGARRDSLVAQPGWWITWGAAWPAGRSPARLARAYWHVTAEGAPALVAELSDRLDRAGAAWALKLPSTPALFARADAGVLLVDAGAWTAVAGDVAAAHEAVAGFLEPATPALALPVAAGLAVAQDPGPSESFGGQRCRLIAEALVAAPGTGEDEALEAVREHLRAAGIDPARPHLGPAAGPERQSEALPGVAPAPPVVAPPPPAAPSPAVPAPTPAFAAPQPAVAAPPAARAEDLQAAATGLGRRLVEEAIWHEDRCTWTGDDMAPGEQAWVVVHRSLGASLYNGSAGVARFLAVLARAGDAAAGATARGAIRHALRHAERLASRRGLYDGALGVALAALETGEAVGDPDLWAAGAGLARDCAGAPMPEAAVDLVSGDAGAALGFLAAARLVGDRGLHAEAVAHGERLVAAAQTSAAGLCWAGPAGMPPLCGLAHGASGAVLALGELARATGRADFAQAAAAALRWERAHFDRAGGGWPDRRGPATGAYPAHWCHGAGGIGVVRLRRHAQTGDPVALAEAGAALENVRLTSSYTTDGSVCHGLAGLAEVLLAAHAALGTPEHLADARALGAALAMRAGAEGAWPCGIPGGGETPALMTGLAGIGLTLLRLHDPASAPSPALPPGLAAY